MDQAPRRSNRPAGLEHEGDPQRTVGAPVITALNTIIVCAAAGFAIVVAFATVPLIAELDPQIHIAVHLGIPIGALAYAGLVFLVIARRSVAITNDPWERASAVDPGLAHFARLVSGFMMGGSLASLAAVLVHHHLTSPVATALTFATDAPILLASWAVAAHAWTRWSRYLLARAEREADERFRSYWRSVAR